MPQPRKEQIKDLRTKFTHYVGKSPNPIIAGGGSSTQVLTGADYTNFLAATRTGAVGGAETDTPVMVQGGSGPFNLTTLNSFSIKIPGYNGNAPMNVAIQSSDIVTLGGIPVVTTSHLANRINIVTLSFGITNPIAFNVNGSLVINTVSIPLLGNSASFTLADIVFGTLALIGLVATTYTGVSSPTRGIVTLSSDGLGGYVQLKNLDQTTSEPINTNMVHMGQRQYAPVVMPGQPAFARLTAPPSSLRFDFYRNGPINSNVVSKLSNFASISPGDTVLIELNYSASLSNNFNVIFGTVTTVQNVIDQINNAYAASTLSAFGVESTRASVISQIPGPWSFRNSNSGQRDSFQLQFNTNPSVVHVVPVTDGTPVSTLDFATLINNVITATLGSLVDGHAVASGDNIIIESQILGSTSSVTFLSDVSINDPNSMLNMLGISPGTYTSSILASLYGADEIQLINPSALSNSGIAVIGDPGIITNKLGIIANTFISVSTGLAKVSLPIAQTLIPEVVEFSEEPDNYDTNIQNFNAVGNSTSIDPQKGVQNFGLVEGLLGVDGKIDSTLLSSILNFLGLDRIALGSRLIDSLASQSQPRVTTPYDIIQGPVLIWTGTATTGSAQANVTRLYLFGFSVYLTINAYVSSYGGSGPLSIIYTIEGHGLPYLYEFTSGKFSVASYSSSTPGVTFAHGAWVRNVKLNTTGVVDATTGFGSEILKLGEGLTGSVPNLLIPRIEIAEDPTSPSRILMIESISVGNATAYPVRIYIAAESDLGSGLEIVVNAKWSGTQWSKDNAGLDSFYYSFRDGITCQRVLASNPGPWIYWDTAAAVISLFNFTSNFASTVTLGVNSASPVPTLDAPGNPRLQVDRADVTVHHRTLLFISAISSSASDAIRIYLENADTGFVNAITQCVNCYWNDSTNLWVQDNPAHASSAFIVGSSASSSTPTILQLTKNPGSSPWGDFLTNWDKVVNPSANTIVAEGSPASLSRINFSDPSNTEVDVLVGGLPVTFDTVTLASDDIVKTNLGPFLVTNADGSNAATVFVSFGDNLGAGGFVDVSSIEIAKSSSIAITIPSRHLVSTSGLLRVKLRVQSGPAGAITIRGLDNNNALGTYEVIRP